MYTTAKLHFALFEIVSLADYLYNPTDVTPPVFMRCSSDIRANINANATALVNWTEPVALDNGDLPPQVTVVPAGISPPYIFNKTTLIVYTATDGSGNKRECSFRVVLKGGSEKVALLYIWMWLSLKR